MSTGTTMQAFLIRESRGTQHCHGCGRAMGRRDEPEEYAVHLTKIDAEPDAFERVHATQTLLCARCIRHTLDGLSALEHHISQNRAEDTTQAQRRAREERELNNGYSPSEDGEQPPGWTYRKEPPPGWSPSPSVDARLKEAFEHGQ